MVDALSPAEMIRCRLGWISVNLSCLHNADSALREEEAEDTNGSSSLLLNSSKDSFPSLLSLHFMAWWNRVCKLKAWEKNMGFYFLVCLCFFFMTTSKLRSIYSPFVFSVIYVLWLSKLPTLQADICSFTYFRTRSHQPVNRFLSAFSHCLGRVKTGWLISPCPLFPSCISGIQWDWCPSDHLCTAQELDVLSSVCGSQQLLHHCL